LKAIFFDAGGTLLYIHPSVGDVYASVTREMGVNLSNDVLASRLHEIWEDHAPTNTVRDGNLEASDQKDREMWRTFLKRLHDDLDPLQELDFDRWFHRVFERFGEPGTFRLYPETVETLRQLRERGYHLGIVSNWDSRLLSICRGLELEQYVEFILPSAVAGYRKPSPKIFRQALERVEVPAGEALHVGDKERDDYRGSKSVGLEPVLLDRDDRHTGTDRTVISSLDEVLNVVESESHKARGET